MNQYTIIGLGVFLVVAAYLLGFLPIGYFTIETTVCAGDPFCNERRYTSCENIVCSDTVCSCVTQKLATNQGGVAIPASAVPTYSSVDTAASTCIMNGVSGVVYKDYMFYGTSQYWLGCFDQAVWNSIPLKGYVETYWYLNTGEPPVDECPAQLQFDINRDYYVNREQEPAVVWQTCPADDAVWYSYSPADPYPDLLIDQATYDLVVSGIEPPEPDEPEDIISIITSWFSDLWSWILSLFNWGGT